MNEKAPVPGWRRAVAIAMRIAASLVAVVAILMGTGAIRWLIIEFRTGERSTQPLFGIDFSLGEALAGGTLFLVGVVLALWVAAKRTSG